jgi:ABC-type spermidine/putrescine transport system permease subunit II
LLTIALPACRATVGLSWLIVFFFSLQASVEVIMLKGTREQGLFDLTGTLWRQESYPAAFALGVIVLTGAGVILMIVLLLTGSSAVGKVRRSAG